MKRKLITISLSLILFLLFASPALAQGPEGAQVIFGDNLTLEGEQTLNRDVVVFGGSVTVDETSKIAGDMVVFGGNATIDGTVAGDIALIGGNLTLGETAVVEGDIGMIGGRPDIADGATIDGDVQNLTRLDFDYDEKRREDSEGIIPPLPSPPPAPPVDDFDRFYDGPNPFRWIGRMISDIFWTFSLLVVLGLITWLVAAFMPEQMMTVRETVTDSTPTSFGFGLLTSVILAVSFLLVFTICLAFVPLLAALLIGIATLFGWIVIGQIIGERLIVASGRPQPNLILSSIVGVGVLTLVTNMPVIGEIPCIGFLLTLIGTIVGIVISLTGLGAVLLTRFGTRPYPQNPYAGPGGPPPSPRRRSYTSPSDPDDLGVATASEAELNARIKAALAEADEPPQADEPEPEEPAPEEPDDDQGPADDDPEDPEPDRTSPTS